MDAVTVEKLIARRVARGGNRDESATMLAEIMGSGRSSDVKARDLAWWGFATARQAESVVESWWEAHERPDTVAQAAERFGWTVAQMSPHAGRHVCIDGRNYVDSCIMRDRSCHAMALSILARRTA